MASDLLLEIAEEWSLPDEVVERMILVVGEAVSNAAEHGNASDSALSVELAFGRSDERVWMWVSDEGPGITQQRIDEAKLPDDPFDTDGRGLYIIREMADRVWLEEGGRRLCASWDLPAQPE
jgi:serine/threonine-protein kinase RsbW